MGADWRDSQIRYLVHFSDGGSGMRHGSRSLSARVSEGIEDGVRLGA